MAGDEAVAVTSGVRWRHVGGNTVSCADIIAPVLGALRRRLHVAMPQASGRSATHLPQRARNRRCWLPLSAEVAVDADLPVSSDWRLHTGYKSQNSGQKTQC